MNADSKKRAEWLRFRLQASNGFVGLPNRLVDSKAFAALTTGASVKTLIWFWQMANYGKRSKKPGTETSIGRIDKIENNGKLSFTYQEAAWRGMNSRRFSRALKDLFRLGFIDVAHLGRGVRGDYTRYEISTRWQRYGTPEWKEIPFPENFREGFRLMESRKNNGRKRPLPTDENIRYDLGKNPNNGRRHPLKTVADAESQRTKTSVSIDLAMPIETLNELLADASTRFGPVDGRRRSNVHRKALVRARGLIDTITRTEATLH